MTTFNNRITNFVIGDDLEIIRTVTDIVSGTSLSTAWLTIKVNYADADMDAVLQKIINSGLNPGVGQITDTGLDGNGRLVFDLGPNDTGLLEPTTRYPYDIQVETSDGRLTTLEVGQIYGNHGITFAT